MVLMLLSPLPGSIMPGQTIHWKVLTWKWNALTAMKNRPDRSDVLRNSKVPVLFIIGEKDQAIPHEYSMEQTHLAETASIHILPKVAHMGMFEAEKPTQLIIRQFADFCFGS